MKMSFRRAIFCFVFLPFAWMVWIIPLFAAPSNTENVTVTRDKDKTVYTIGSGKEQEDPEREKAREMLKDINIWTRDKNGKGPDLGR